MLTGPNIVVSGLIWGGAPRQLLELSRDGRVNLFTSSLLLDELADVLAREKFAALLTSQNITPIFLMQCYGMLARLVKPQPITRTVRDVDDDAVIATGDRDLLVLHPWEGMQILSAVDVLGLVRNKV